MKFRSVAHVFFIGCIALPCVGFGQTSHPEGVLQVDALPKLPAPSGPFGIGRVGYDWIDLSRPDEYSGGRRPIAS